GEHVVADLDRLVPDDVAAAADRAARPDPDDRIGAEVLAGDHAGRQGDALADEGVVADLDPLLAEDRTDREGDAGALAEPAEAVPGGVLRADGPGRAYGGPPLVDQAAGGAAECGTQ